MKKLFVLLIVFALSGCKMDFATEQDDSLALAKQFCTKTNTECLNILSFDFDKTYAEGQTDSGSRFKWSTLVARKAKDLESLCDNAPDMNVCEEYRDTLLRVYIAGLSK